MPKPCPRAIQTTPALQAQLDAALKKISELEEHIERKESQLRRLEKLADVGHYELNADMSEMHVSPGLLRIWGLSPDSNPNIEFLLEQLHPDDKEWVLEEFGKAVQEGVGFDMICRIIRPDGSVVTIHSLSERIDNPGGKARFFGTLLNISDYQNAQTKLEEIRDRLQEAQRIAKAGSWEWRASDDSLTWSREMYNIMGFDPTGPVPGPEDRRKHFTADSHKRMESAVGKLMTDRTPFEIEMERVQADGSVQWLTLRCEPWYDARGVLYGMRGVAIDITKEKLAGQEKASLEEQLRQAQKLESVGRLAGGIAHDFNNLLVPILGYTELISMRAEKNSLLEQEIRAVGDAAERASQLVKQLLAFGRKQVLDIQNYDLNNIVGDLKGMIRRLIPTSIHVSFHLDKNPCTIYADRVQIDQILLNLTVNASDAMPNGGEIIIETANVELDERYHHSHHDVEPGFYVMLLLAIRESV